MGQVEATPQPHSNARSVPQRSVGTRSGTGAGDAPALPVPAVLASCVPAPCSVPGSCSVQTRAQCFHKKRHEVAAFVDEGSNHRHDSMAAGTVLS